MRYFPLFLDLATRRVVIVGGGEQAAQKARLLRRTEAELVLMAPELCPELQELVHQGHASHVGSVLDAGAMTGARLVIVATGCAAADAAAADLARRAGAVVNVVDRPALSDATMPAIVDRDPVVVAIGTEGTAPVLARRIKTRIETMLEPGLGRFARLAGGLRARVAQHIAPRDRRAFWEWAMAAPRRMMAEGREADAGAALDAVIATGTVPAAGTGRLSIVDPGTGAPDLLTLRAVERLQAADILYHGTDCPVAVLDLARRDVERRMPTPLDGPRRWQIERDLRQALTEVEVGHTVVWLGAAADIAPVLERLGQSCEIVPAVAAQPPSAMVARAEHG